MGRKGRTSNPVTWEYGSMLVGATHPYTEEAGSGSSEAGEGGQDFEFAWVIEERELFWSDVREVHAFKSPIFSLPEVHGPEFTQGASRIQLQIEVPPLITDNEQLPCRVYLISPVEDAFRATINGHPYILRERPVGKEGVLFMVSAEVQQKESRRSKFYHYEFHLRFSKVEMEMNGLYGVSTRDPAPSGGPQAPVAAAPADSAAGMDTRSPVAGASSSALVFPLSEDRDVSLTFRDEDQVLIVKQSILCSQSPRFREMMNDLVRGNRIRIPAEITFETMKEVVRFLQFGYCRYWLAFVEDIFAAAVYFEIPRLRDVADHKRALLGD